MSRQIMVHEEARFDTIDGFAFNRYECISTPLNVALTLTSGQNFRWLRDSEGVWWGTIGDAVVALWQQEKDPDGPLFWQTFPDPDRWDLIADYFRLDVDLEALYADWRQGEPAIGPALDAYRGMRVLRQPPEECLFAFQCAACNTVVKIERSVRQLASRYGRPLIIAAAKAPYGLHAFPTIDALADADESLLRSDLWGYRAPRVIALARHLQALPPAWLTDLRKASYAEAHGALTALAGIGAKLADCICLFALDKDAAVPVDTHIRQIACNLFLPEMAEKSLTPRVYAAIADCYRSRFGAYAGWAQQYLFYAHLRRHS